MIDMIKWKMPDFLKIFQKRNDVLSVQEVPAKVPEEKEFPVFFEYSEGTPAYKKLVEWICGGESITSDDFEEGMACLSSLEDPGVVFAHFLSCRDHKEVELVEKKYFDWHTFDIRAFDTCSTAALEAVKKMEKPFDQMRFLGRLYNQNRRIERSYRSNLFCDFSFSDDSFALDIFDRQEKAIVEAAVGVRQMPDCAYFYYTSLFPTFSESRYFLPSLRDVDDNGIISMISKFHEEIPHSYNGRMAYMNFLLDAQDKVNAGAFSNIDPQNLGALITKLSEVILKKDVLERGVDSYSSDPNAAIVSRITDSDAAVYKEFFARIDARRGSDVPFLTSAFNKCMSVCHMARDNLTECGNIDRKAAEEKMVLNNALAREVVSAKKVCNMAFNKLG